MAAVIPALQQVLWWRNGVSGNFALHKCSGDGPVTQESGDGRSYRPRLAVWRRRRGAQTSVKGWNTAAAETLVLLAGISAAPSKHTGRLRSPLEVGAASQLAPVHEVGGGVTSVTEEGKSLGTSGLGGTRLRAHEHSVLGNTAVVVCHKGFGLFVAATQPHPL